MEKAVDRVIEALQPLTEKLGAGAEVVWESAMKQQIIEGWFALAVALVVGVITLALVVGGLLVARNERDPFDAVAFSVTSLFIGGTATSITGYMAVTHLLNPEWQAIQSFLSNLQ